MGLKVVTFDMTGTLLRFRRPPYEVYASVAKHYGLECNNIQEIKQNFRDTFKHMAKEHPNFGRQSNLGWSKWWVQVVKETLNKSCNTSNDSSLEAVAWHLVKLYSTSQPWEMCPGVPETLHRLRSKGIIMGVVSNFDPRLEQIIQSSGISHLFSFLICSYNAGCMKPDPKIFQLALDEVSSKTGAIIEPDKCCHVGDTYETDYVGALQSGWRGILIGDTSRLACSQDFCPDMNSLTVKLGF